MTSVEPIVVVLLLLLVHGALGAFDTFVNHEWRERLPAQPWAGRELATHSARSLLFAAIFAGVAWFEWHGAWGWAMLGLMAAEVGVTLADSVFEDRTRRLSVVERTNHMLLMLNTGAYMGFFALQVGASWHALPSAVVPAAHPPLLAWPLTACAVAVLVWAVRDGVAAHRQRGRALRELAATPHAAH
jgi:hypothetical protein